MYFCALNYVHWPMQCVHCSVQCVYCSVQCTVCTLYTVHCTVYSVHTVHCTLYSVYTVQCTMCRLQTPGRMGMMTAVTASPQPCSLLSHTVQTLHLRVGDMNSTIWWRYMNSTIWMARSEWHTPCNKSQVKHTALVTGHMADMNSNYKHPNNQQWSMIRLHLKKKKIKLKKYHS